MTQRTDHLTGVLAALVLGTAGAVAAALGGATSWAVPAAGAGIGAVTFAAHAATTRRHDADRRTRTNGHREDAGSRAPAPDGAPPEDAVPWLERAGSAAGTLDRHAHAATGTALAAPLTAAAGTTRAAVEQLRARAAALRVIDTAVDDGILADLEQQRGRLAQEADTAAPGALRDAKRASVRALEERIAALERLTRLRGLLTATLEATTLSLEAAADRGTVLLSLQTAQDAGGAPVDLTALTDELEAVQAGLDRLDDLSRTMRDGGAP
ncbi:hypothetical protein [Streptomyces broussonetiae]|uniref:Secreted protein n=1 Tax=Streptomyces broussonetiae TaxID=2686304 RepID=A0ABV5EGG5_9ACTN